MHVKTSNKHVKISNKKKNLEKLNTENNLYLRLIAAEEGLVVVSSVPTADDASR